MTDNDLDERGHPRVKPGYIRVYVDHTGRWYEDYTEAEYKQIQEDFNNDPLAQILKEEITAEIDRQLIAKLRDV